MQWRSQSSAINQGLGPYGPGCSYATGPMIVSDACTAETLAGKAHLNIFEMVELFKTEQSHMETSILQLNCCRRNSEKGPSRKRKEERIQKIEDKFDAGIF